MHELVFLVLYSNREPVQGLSLSRNSRIYGTVETKQEGNIVATGCSQEIA